MQTHNLIQGSPEWHAYRAQHFNASDAPAMLGCSAYKTRSQLIAELATGAAAEVDSFTQRRFDDGHRYEALARTVVEDMLGEELYPVVGSEGRYSASFDGLTLDESTGFEHKSLNDELRALMGPGCSGADLPKMYRVQMEQQCMVSGASRILFMASKWNGDVQEESYHCWYTPDEALRAEIVAGWAQLEADVAAYVSAAVPEKLIAESIDTLPSIAVQIRGEVVASNLPAFRDRLAAFIAGVNTNLVTDQDFANAEAAVKTCTETEARIGATKEQVLGQVSSIDEVVRALDDAKAQLAKLRLHLDKEIKAKKQALKDGIVAKAQQAFREHIAGLEKEIVPLTLVCAPRGFAEVIKGLKSITSIQNAVDTELAAGKIAADAIAAGVRARHAWFKEVAAEYLALFPDLQGLIQKADDDFKLVVNTRIDKQKADDEAKLQAERQRLAEVAAASAAEPALPIDLAAPGAERTVRTHLAGEFVNIADNATPPGPPTLKLGTIAERLGFAVTAEFLLSLGFKHTTEKGAKLYHEGDFKLICAAIIRHVSAAAARTDFSPPPEGTK